MAAQQTMEANKWRLLNNGFFKEGLQKRLYDGSGIYLSDLSSTQGFQLATDKKGDQVKAIRPLEQEPGLSVYYFDNDQRKTDPKLYFSYKVTFSPGKPNQYSQPKAGKRILGQYGSSNHTKRRKPSTSKESTILMLVAKDHEYVAAKKAIKEHGKEWKEIEEEIFEERGKYTRYSWNRACLIVASAHCFGMHAVSMFEKYVENFEPQFVYTVGCCAGKEPAPSSTSSSLPVYIITEAVSMDSEENYQSTSHPESLSMFRVLKKYINFVGRPDSDTRANGRCRVLSVSGTTVDNQDELYKKLEDYSASCLDMEIFFLFRSIRRRNEKVPVDKQISLLPALKGFSDSGDKKQREKNLNAAVTLATWAGVFMASKIAE